MDLQSFNSIFELFATFFLAYIIIDELSENHFISLVSERVLRKYRRIDKIFAEIFTTISGHRTSLNNLAQLGITDPIYTERIGSVEKIMKSTFERAEQSSQEIKKVIRLNSSTKVFVYLNAYLFLYCFSILVYGGLYASVQPGATWAKDYNSSIDDSLFLFILLSSLYLIVGWRMDKVREPNSHDDDDDDNFFKSLGEKINGYLFAALSYVLIIILSTIAFWFDWHIVHFENWRFHNLLIIMSMVLPFFHFFIYIIKAHLRAKKSLPNLLIRTKAYKADYGDELKKVEAFINHCGALTLPKVETKE